MEAQASQLFGETMVSAAAAYARALISAELGDRQVAAVELQVCAPPTVGSAVEKMIAMEYHCPFRARLMDDNTHQGLEAEFVILRQLSQMGSDVTFASLVRWLKSHLVEGLSKQDYHVSERAFTSGLMLFVRYLVASRWEREEQCTARGVDVFECPVVPNPSSDSMAHFQQSGDFQVHKVAVRCIHMTSSFGDGRNFRMNGEDTQYHNHVLRSLRFDVAEASPVDYIGIVERLAAPTRHEAAYFSDACMLKLPQLVESSFLFYCCTAARVCAVIIVATLKEQGNFDASWVANWSAPLVEALELLSPTASPVAHPHE